MIYEQVALQGQIAPEPDWQRRRLKYLVKFVGGATPSTDDPSFWNGDIPWVSPKDMKIANIFDAEDHLSEIGLASCSSRRVTAGSVLIVVRSGILRHTFPVAINVRDVALNQDMKALIPRDELVARFLRYIFMANQPAALDMLRKQGATVESIDQELLSNMVIAFPEVDKQEAIADFLDRETAEADALVSKYERLIELLEEKRVALITDAVTKGLDSNAALKDSKVDWIGDIPANWLPSRVKFCATKIGSGVTPRGGSETYTSDGVMFLRSQNVYNDGLRLDEVAYISVDVDKEMCRTQIHENDVLLNITGASIGRTCIVPSSALPANVNQHVCIIRPSSKISARYLAYALKSRSIREQITGGENGSSREGLNYRQVGDLYIAVPKSLAEQTKIVKHLDDCMISISGAVAKVSAAKLLVLEHRSALITAAVTGQIDVSTYRSGKQMETPA